MTAVQFPERSAARLVAVQALYQIELTGTPWQDVVIDHAEHRICKSNRPDSDGDDGDTTADNHRYVADRQMFQAIVAATMRRTAEIDRAIHNCLPAGWALERLDPVLRAAFRAAGAEFLNAADTPTKVIISEYVNMAAEFGGEPKEIAFANGVLATLAETLRPQPIACA